MESVNLAETHQTEDISKAKSNGARVPGCPCCDNRAFIQTNLFGPFYPPLPRSRTCQEITADLIFRGQPYFFYPHFTQPFIQDNLVSQNYCCANDCIKNQSSKPNVKDKVVHECGQIRRQVFPHMFCQKMERNQTKDKNGVDNEPHDLPQWPRHTKEPEWSNQTCNCGESLPWTSSPFILPIISYCVMWNRQSDNNFDYTCNQMVNVTQTTLGGDVANTENKTKCEKQSESENESAMGYCSEDDGSKKEIEKSPNRGSTSSVSLNSSTQDEDKIYVKQKSSSSSTKAGSDVHSEEEAAEELQVRSSNLSNNSQNHLSANSSEKVFPNDGDYCVIFSAENQSEHSSRAGSEHDLKVEDSSSENEEVNDEIKCVASEENNIPVSTGSSHESIEEKDVQETNAMEVEPCSIKSAATPKKFIKNFTMTTRTEETIPEKSQNSAAGGDLGGNTCTGFKMRIDSEETKFDAENQNSQLKTISLKGMEEKKTGKSSGIARLIHSNVSRDTKSIKRDSNDLDNINMKRKRCQTDSQIREDTFKIVKVTTPKINQKDRGGSENQSEAAIISSRLSKQAGKSPAPKVRPHNCSFKSKK